MRYGNRDKPVHKSGRVGFVEGRLNELRWTSGRGECDRRAREE